jgi:formate dehydrogenase gamma subunit
VSSKKRSVSLSVVAAFVALWAAAQYAAATSPQTPPAPGPVAPNAAGSVAGQASAPDAGPDAMLQCQGCHGPGKVPPYLAGALFHTDAHSAYGDGYHAKSVQNGRRAATCLDCHALNGDMTTMLPKNDPRSPISRANVATTCGKCHGDSSVMQGTGITTRPFLTYQESVHARALSRGDLGAAVCTDCHNGHDVLPASDPRSPIFKANVPQTCGRCHAGITVEFNESVHGIAAARGVSQTPVCTDCHGIHNILPGQIAQSALRTNTCERCHEGVRLTEEFGIAGGRVASYQDSYHGLAKKLGSSVAADCASCHGVHNILPSTDPKSTIAQANLALTCGQCHPGASENFANSKIHVNSPLSQDPGSVGVRWVRFFYLGLIVVTVGGMFLHNALAWRKKLAARMRAERRTIVRMTRSQRIQHWLLLTSFIALVVTGFALVYPDIFFDLGMTEEMRRLVHRVAAIVMLGVGAYHVVYLVAAREGRSWLRDMVPVMKDVRDLVQALRYYLSGNVARPKFLRFGYAEKAEYWAVVWGTVIMGATGLMIWFKIDLFGFLPRWWVDIAIAVHFYEAVLATLAIVVWHFYHVMFDPDVYPVNLAFYDGRVSDELYREEHELDYERMQAEKSGERDAETARDETAREGTIEVPAEDPAD